MLTIMPVLAAIMIVEANELARNVWRTRNTQTKYIYFAMNAANGNVQCVRFGLSESEEWC